MKRYISWYSYLKTSKTLIWKKIALDYGTKEALEIDFCTQDLVQKKERERNILLWLLI